MLGLVAWLPPAAAWAQDPKPPPPPDQPAPPADTAGDEQDELVRRLIQQAGQAGEEDIMDRIIRLMGESQRGLEIRFEPGPQTQAVQQGIVDKLDEAIKTAARNQRKSSSSSMAGSSDKRRSKPAPAKPGSSGEADSNDAAESDPNAARGRVPDQDVNAARGALLDRRRGWGRLPEREREEVIQGAGESALERYQAWIERYYRALQNDEEPR